MLQNKMYCEKWYTNRLLDSLIACVLCTGALYSLNEWS